MKLLICCFLLAAVAVKIEATLLPDTFLTKWWLPAPAWTNSYIIKNNRSWDKNWGKVWELIKRQLYLNMKKIADEYATEKGASKDQLIGLLVINYEMYRYHWRTISKGIQYYVQAQKKILDADELKAFCDKYTMMFARCLKLERFYDYGMKHMPVPVTNEDYGKTQSYLEMIPIPANYLTGNKEMSYPQT